MRGRKRARRRRRWVKKVKKEKENTKKGGFRKTSLLGRRKSRRNMHDSLMVFRSFVLLALTQQRLDKVHELRRY